MMNLWSKEPVAIVNAVRLVCLAAMTFGLHLTDVQLGASMLALEALLTLFTRAQVTSAASLQEMTPRTLAAAQDASQPVKDVVRKLPVVVLAVLLASSSACMAGKVTGATPAATAALNADAVVIRVNELQAAVISACGPAPQCQPNSLSTPLARDIVQTCIDLRATLKAVPDGWQATAKAAWRSARPRFSAVTNPTIQIALAAVDAYLGGL